MKRLEPFKKKKPQGSWEDWVSLSWFKLLFVREKFINNGRAFAYPTHVDDVLVTHIEGAMPESQRRDKFTLHEPCDGSHMRKVYDPRP